MTQRAADTVLLQREDFKDFPVGDFPYHYGAHGEYHYWPIKGYRGSWYEPTIKSRWRSAHWLVLESDGEHLMTHATLSTDCWGVLVTGDEEREDYAVGRIALWAVCPARFGHVEVTTTPEAKRFFVQRRDAKQRELDELRERNPKPVLWKTINTTGFGAGRHVRFGDLNGDGRLELVLAQNVKMIDGGNYGMISCLTAIDLDGNVLWRIGEPSATPSAGSLTADVPFQIYDLDGDGHAEVVYCRDYMINVADGRTGKLKYQAPTPIAVHPEKYVLVPDDPTYRITGDSLAFANLRYTGTEGGPRAADLILKNRYNQIWAFDEHLNLRWTDEHNTGHFLRVYDVDGDGRDEIITGYTLMDGDGNVLWQHTHFVDHADEIAIGRFDPERKDHQIAQAAGEDGFLIFSEDGGLLLQDRVGHVQRVSVAKYRPDVPGLQYYVV